MTNPRTNHKVEVQGYIKAFSQITPYNTTCYYWFTSSTLIATIIASMFILEFWYARIHKSAKPSKSFCKPPCICLTIRPQNKVLQKTCMNLSRYKLLKLWISMDLPIHYDGFKSTLFMKSIQRKHDFKTFQFNFNMFKNEFKR